MGKRKKKYIFEIVRKMIDWLYMSYTWPQMRTELVQNVTDSGQTATVLVVRKSVSGSLGEQALMFQIHRDLLPTAAHSPATCTSIPAFGIPYFCSFSLHGGTSWFTWTSASSFSSCTSALRICCSLPFVFMEQEFQGRWCWGQDVDISWSFPMVGAGWSPRVSAQLFSSQSLLLRMCYPTFASCLIPCYSRALVSKQHWSLPGPF